MSATTVENADSEAQQARAAVQQAEDGVRSGRKPASAKKLLELVTNARHAELAAQAARDQADQDRRDARERSLEGLASEIDQVAAQKGAAIAEALTDLCEAAGRVRAAAAEHDMQVAELARTAAVLGCREPAPGGPRTADARIAVRLDGSVQHAETLVVPANVRMLDQALEYALAGDLVSALAEAQTTRHVPTPARADLYVRGRGGMVLPVFGSPDVHQAAAIVNGSLTRLNESQINSYLEGDDSDDN
jgi:hypothetical protein